MKQFKKEVLSLGLMTGALALAALPVWAQSGSPSERSGAGSSVSQGQSGASEGARKSAPLRDDRTQTGSMDQGQSPDEKGAAGSRSGGMAGNEEIKKVQQALKEKGQDPGVIDGVMGPKTKDALKAFQEQQGLKASGTLDQQTKKALGIEQGASAGRSSSARSGKSSGKGAAGSGSTEDKSVTRGAEGGKEQ